MFDTLTDRLTQSLRNVAGTGQLTEDNIKDTLREVRMALLEADVALPVTRDFIAKVKEQALGQEVLKQLSPGQAFVKIVHDELVSMMGDANESLDLAAKPPVVILLAGLQGAGKTTTAAKLARFLKERQKKKSRRYQPMSIVLRRSNSFKQFRKKLAWIGLHQKLLKAQLPLSIVRLNKPKLNSPMC